MDLKSRQRSERPSRLRRLWTREKSELEARRTSIGPNAGEIVLLGAWFGFLTGLLELASLLGQRQFLGVSSLGLLQMNRHARWMIPVSNLMIFLAVGLLLAPLGFTRSARARWGALLVLNVLMFLTLVLTFRGLYKFAYLFLTAGLASAAFRSARARSEGFRKLVGRSLPVLAIGVLALVGLDLGGQSFEERRTLLALPEPPPSAPNVLLIVLDTVRAESTSLHGYERDTTPVLRRLSEQGIRFDHARVPAPWTLPAHASIFTSRWPHELSSKLDQPLDDTYDTIAEYLRDRGYATAGFVANRFFCNAWYGLGRGFLHYDDSAITWTSILGSSGLGRRVARTAFPSPVDRPSAYFRRKNAETLNREFLQWIDGPRPEGRPFFAFLNYFDAHDPYLPPDGWKRRFGLQPEGKADFALLRDWHEATRTNPEVPERDVTLAIDSYDECIAYLDEQLGLLFDDLDRRGILDETLIIITSDHGELFGEHGIYGHGSCLYRPVLHVPLLIVGPSRSEIPASGVIEAPVSLRDLPATIADLLPFSEPGRSPFQGRSLARYWEVPGAESDPVLAEMLDNGPPALSLVAAGASYIRNGDGREELYQLQDLDEATNLSADPEHQEVLNRLRDLLARILGGESP
ncbi:hypothetical protein BH23PLA1_BH23PLA1_06630 [soil metagenome]